MAPWQEAIQVSFNMVGPKQEEPKGCLPKRVFGILRWADKTKTLLFFVVDPCLDQGSLNMSILGGWSKLMLMPMYGLESLYNDPLLIYTPNFRPEYPCSETMSWRQVIHFFFVFSNKMVFRIHLPILLQKYLKEFFSESIFQELLFRIDFVWFSPNIWTDSRPWGFCRNLHTTRSSWHWMMAIYRPSVHLMASTIIGSKRVSFKCLRDYQVARTR